MPRVAVVGNVARDIVDGGAPTPGGGPTFAAESFRRLGEPGQIVTRYAEVDGALFAHGLAGATLLPATRTSGFELDYAGDERAMRVTAIGERWSPGDAAALEPGVEWVHVAPLLRDEFPGATLGALAHGRRLSLDGQGLVRVSGLGELREDAAFDPAALEHVTALKLSEHEAAIVGGGRFDLAAAERLGVPEVLLTLGSRGVVVFADGEDTAVPVPRPVADVPLTGAGDAFMVAYAVARLDGREPVDAARTAVAFVCDLLARRLPPG